jgi:tetraacyldisaccharide 4'-kinase
MKLSPAQIDAVMSGRDRSAGAGFFRAVAACAEPFYRSIIAARNFAYDRGWPASIAAPLPVISVGNLTTGGAGKTPITAWVARRLIDWSIPPAILMRGYGAPGDGPGDEQTLLSEELPGVPVIADPDRAAAAIDAAARHPEARALLLDDGFQHRRLKRDLDLVLIDATAPFGHEHLLPRGLLREPPSALRRAGGVIVTRADRVAPQALADLQARIRRHHGREATACFSHDWSGVVDARGDAVDERSEPVLAVCAIGNPAAFFEQAKSRMDVRDAVALPDHHRYDAGDLMRLADAARRCGARAVLVTQKDWVKLRRLIESRPHTAWPFWRPILQARCLAGQAELESLIRAAAGREGSP